MCDQHEPETIKSSYPGPLPVRLLCGLLVGFIRFYQRYISFIIGPVCRFEPSCSNYALQALKKRGLHIAIPLILWRVLRCNPLCKGGFDPVPEKLKK